MNRHLLNLINEYYNIEIKYKDELLRKTKWLKYDSDRYIYYENICKSCNGDVYHISHKYMYISIFGWNWTIK